jgi:hypothetical protein
VLHFSHDDAIFTEELISGTLARKIFNCHDVVPEIDKLRIVGLDCQRVTGCTQAKAEGSVR